MLGLFASFENEKIARHIPRDFAVVRHQGIEPRTHWLNLVAA